MKVTTFDQLCRQLNIERPIGRERENGTFTASARAITSGVAGEPFQIHYTSAVSPAPKQGQGSKLMNYASSIRFPHADVQMERWFSLPHAGAPTSLL